MTAKLVDERISTLNHILFQKEDTHQTSEDSVVVLRNLTKSKTSINSIQDFFQPLKLNYVRIFEEPEALEESLNLGLRKFHIGGEASDDNAATQSSSPKVSVLIEFDSTENLDPYFKKLGQVPNAFGSFEITIETIHDTVVEKNESQNLLNSPPKVLYDSIVIENISEFFGDKKPTVEEFESFLSKFKVFGKIDAIYFPTKSIRNQELDFKSVGFVGFAHKADLNESILKCLYFLHDLDFESFHQFDGSDVVDISTDHPESHEVSDSTRIKLSICQKKHEPFLFNNYSGVKLDGEGVKVLETESSSDAPADNATYERFAKNINFQQSNIYVNNLPIVFQNDDNAWFDFWIQFGSKDSIKSAKIIKPQFYSRRQNSPYGKFGFVFYNDLKPALKAILLTNNRLVSGFADYPKFHIEASFAIQKSTSERFQQNYAPQPLRQDSFMVPFPYGPPLQSLPNSSMNFNMPIYDGYGYRSKDKPNTVPKPRSKSVSAQANHPPAPEHLQPPLYMAPYENYYNYYVAMPFHMQVNFAPNGAPAFGPAPFHNEQYTYGSQYGYYPFPGQPNVPPKRRTSE